MPGLCGRKATLNCCFLWAPLVVRLGLSVTWKLSLYIILSLSLFFFPPPPPPSNFCCLYILSCSVSRFQSNPFVVLCMFWSVPFLVFGLPPLYLLICSFGTVYPLCCCLYAVCSDLFCSFDPIYCMAGAAVCWVTLLAELDCLQNLKTRRPG